MPAARDRGHEADCAVEFAGSRPGAATRPWAGDASGTGRLACGVRAVLGRPGGGAARGAGRHVGEGEGGHQAGEEDVEAALELGGAVVGGQDGGEGAEQGELEDRQPVQAQPEQVVGLVGVVDEFLELVEDVAVQEPEQGPVDVQGVGGAEPGAGEEGEEPATATTSSTSATPPAPTPRAACKATLPPAPGRPASTTACGPGCAAPAGGPRPFRPPLRRRSRRPASPPQPRAGPPASPPPRSRPALPHPQMTSETQPSVEHRQDDRSQGQNDQQPPTADRSRRDQVTGNTSRQARKSGPLPALTLSAPHRGPSGAATPCPGRSLMCAAVPASREHRYRRAAQVQTIHETSRA